MEARVTVTPRHSTKHEIREDKSNSRLRLVSSNDDSTTVSGELYDVAVIGLGYVGLPLCLAFAKAGVNVLGVDVDSTKANKIIAGESYAKHIPSGDIAAAVEAEKLNATDDFSKLKNAEAILICVPTHLL